MADGIFSESLQFPDYVPDYKDFMKTGWSERQLSVENLKQAPFHSRRRDVLSEMFPGETVIIPTGKEKVRANDIHYEFRSGSDFYWLTGDREPDGVLVLHPRSSGHEAVIYRRANIRRKNDCDSSPTYREYWTGLKWDLKEASTALGIECRDLRELDNILDGVPRKQARVLRGYDSDIDGRFLPEECAETESRDGYLTKALAQFRLAKDVWELEQLQGAVDATIRGFEDVARILPSSGGIPERLIEGVFSTRARVEGNGVGYSSIVAAGSNSTTIHWTDNTGYTRPGDLLLLDMGVESRSLYTADITRTLPISGSFTPAQRAIYDIVLAAQQAGLEAIKPGGEVLSIRDACEEVLAEGLRELGLIPRHFSTIESIQSRPFWRWTAHNFGHMLGIDVHDCGATWPDVFNKGVVKENYVLTVEPGLYFQPNDEYVPSELRGMGIRIEDDVQVTSDGYRNLSAALPRTAIEIEDWLAAQREAGPRFPAHPDF